jgi:formamidopyrimidine-DNA glycosylase
VRFLRAKTLEAGAPLLEELKGGRVVAARRRAKLALLDVLTLRGEMLCVVFHLKMTGRLLVRPLSAEPHAHTRAVFALELCNFETVEPLCADFQKNPHSKTVARRTCFAAKQPFQFENDSEHAPEEKESAGGCGLFFDDARCFGYCRIMRPEDFLTWEFWKKLGPEPFACPPGKFATRARERRGNIKALLLDQSFIAGIGNIYADESLFRAGVDPRRSATDIGQERMTGLFKRVREVLREAVAACGSSIRDYLDAEGRAGAFQNTFRVYGRGGKPCLACGRRLEKIGVAGRGTVYCPNCQK